MNSEQPEPTPQAPAPDAHSGHALEVLTAWDETPTLRGLRLRVPPHLLKGYRVPGQYLEVSHPLHGRGYFALAAAPPIAGEQAGPEPELELLVRRSSPLSEALAALTPGPTELRATGVLGPGFPIDTTTRELILVASGSGIAPLRAVLQQRLRGPQGLRHVALYFGERSEEDLAYRRELEPLRAHGLQLELVLSRPSPGWRGPAGRVQAHLAAAPPPWLGPTTLALLCGQPEMIADATAVLAGRGVPIAQIRLNY